MSGSILTVCITALVTLSAATFIFYWQRGIEHSFALRKEKRETYRKIIRLITQMDENVIDRDGETFKATEKEIRAASLETMLYSHEKSNIAGNILKLRKAYHNFNANYDQLDTQQRMSEIHNIAQLSGLATKEMRDDLDRTTAIFPAPLQSAFLAAVSWSQRNIPETRK